VEPGLQDHDVLAVDEADQSVFLVDASGLGTGKQATWWLWLSLADTGGGSRRTSSIRQLMR
jgi:hypothetical protein